MLNSISHGHWAKLLHNRRFYMTILALVIDISKVVFNYHMGPTLLVSINGIIGLLVGGDSLVQAKHAAAAEQSAAKPAVVTSPADSTPPTTSKS